MKIFSVRVEWDIVRQSDGVAGEEGRRCGLVEEDVFLVSKCLAWIPLKDFYLDCVARSEMCDYLILNVVSLGDTVGFHE